jgi:hypothetical protein
MGRFDRRTQDTKNLTRLKLLKGHDGALVTVKANLATDRIEFALQGSEGTYILRASAWRPRSDSRRRSGHGEAS